NLPKSNHPPNIAHQKPKHGNSRSCSVTSWTPPNSPPSSILKSTGTCCVHTKKSALKLSNAMKDTLRNSYVMFFWSILDIRKPLRMTRKEKYQRGWVSLMPSEI